MFETLPLVLVPLALLTLALIVWVAARSNYSTPAPDIES